MKKSIFLFFAAILCATNAWGAKLFFDHSSVNYPADGALVAIWSWGGSSPDAWSVFKASGATNKIVADIADGRTGGKIVRFNSSVTKPDWSANQWNSTGDISFPKDKNCIKITKWDGATSGTWSTFQLDSKASVTPSASSVSVGEEVTFTPALTSNQEYNDVLSTTYSVGTGATITDGKFVATEAGTYTVTATVTYNAQGYTNITKTATATCSITVSEVAVPHPVTGVTVAPTSVTIKQGATTTLTATVAPSNADDPSVTWSSDNQSVATVVNGVVTAVAPGTANITVTTVDGGFTATCAVKVKPLQYTFYAINSAEWPTVAAHYWGGADGGSSWPGADMVKESETVNGCDIYSITISSDFINIMFTNKLNGDDKNKKTADLTTEGNDGKYYDIKDAKWYASLSEVPVTYEYYIAGPLAGGWNANQMGLNKVAEGQYACEFTKDAGDYQFKVTNGKWGNETGGFDCADVEGSYEEVSLVDGNVNVKLTKTTTFTVKFDSNTKKISFEGLTTAAPAPTYEYYIAGPLAGGWSATQMGLEKVAEGQYACEFTKDAGDYQFKVTNGKWGNETGGFDCADVEGSYQEVSNVDGNVNVKLTATTTFTVKFDSNTKKISFTGLTEIVVPTFDYYIAGSFNGDDPKKAENGMTLEGEVYKATVTLVEGANTLKVTNGSWDKTWGYSDLGAAYDEVSDAGEYNNIKITLAAAAEKNITVIFNATTGKITFEGLTLYVAPLTYTVTVPTGTEKCYIARSVNGWAFEEMTKVDDTHYTITIAGAKESDTYKYTRGEGWEYVEVNSDGSSKDNRTWKANDVVAKWADVITYVLMGVNGDWTTGIQLTKSSETEYKLLGQTITRNTDKVKVVTLTNGTATAWCGNVDTYSDAIYENDWDNDGNIALEDGIYDFYFKVSEDKIYIDQTTLLRTGTNKYGTIYVPYTPASVSGATFYQVAGKGTVGGEEGVYLESVDNIEAGKPYIYERIGSQVVKIVFSGEKATNGGAVNGLVGTDATATTVAPGHYLLSNNAFCKSDGSSKVRGYRAYLVMEDIVGGEPTRMPGRRYVSMGTQGTNATTGVDNLVVPEGQVLKVIENGQLIIIRGGEKFNVQGMRL